MTDPTPFPTVGQRLTVSIPADPDDLGVTVDDPDLLLTKASAADQTDAEAAATRMAPEADGILLAATDRRFILAWIGSSCDTGFGVLVIGDSPHVTITPTPRHSCDLARVVHGLVLEFRSPPIAKGSVEVLQAHLTDG